MTTQRPLAGLALLCIAALVVGGAWRLVGTLGRSDVAAVLGFVAAALLMITVVGVRSRRWTQNPYW